MGSDFDVLLNIILLNVFKYIIKINLLLLLKQQQIYLRSDYHRPKNSPYLVLRYLT